jgi:serine/threonine protein kinase/Tfp pilus assembly protein PilF
VPPSGFSRYRIDGEIGHGGMGVVFRAWDFALERAVAMKVLHDFIDEDDGFAARFVEEAQVAARLQHPAIVPIYDVGINDAGKLYFTMKLVEGTTLSEVVARARAGGDDARGYTRFRLLETFREICGAIAYVHEHGIVHRDLKPNNVMLGSHGEVQVMDWGLAKMMGGAGAGEGRSLPRLQAAHAASLVHGSSPTTDRADTVAGTVMGTPAYMSPEQVRGESAVSPRWDVYALGGILHHVLTGRAPEAAGTRRGAAEERAGGLAPPRSIDPTIPRELEAICMRALFPTPEARYPTARALADDVQAFLEQRPVAAFHESFPQRAWKWARRRRRAVAGVGLALVVVAGAAVVARGAAARATLDRARADAGAAEDTFARARRTLQAAHLDPAALRAERDRLLGLGMSALEAAQATSALAPKDEAARRGTFDAALGLGEVALEDQQWGLAASAFERARDTHVDDARALVAVEEVERARTRIADAHAKTVADVLDRARSGGLDRDDEYQDALFTLVGISEPATVEALARGLDGVTTGVRAARRDFYLEAQALTADEQRRGETRIDGLETAIDELLATAPDRHAPASEALGRAAARLVARAAAGAPKDAPPPALRTLAAAAEERRVGTGSLRLARLASEALGRIGIANVAVEALERYLAAEDDELRAVPAAIALCLLARPSSERAVGVARDRLGTTNGLFWKLVGSNVRRFRTEPGEEPKTAEDFIARGKERGLKGDIEGGLADFTRAIELAPKATSGFLARGIARRRAGDVDGAIADYSRALDLAPGDAVLWNDRGFAQLERGDLDAAIADLEHSLSLRPSSARTATHRATAYRLKGRLPVAFAGYDAALKIDPRFELAYRGRAEAHVAAGELPLAIADFDRAIELDGHDAEAWAGRALARLLAKDADGALADASRAVELDPTCGPAWIARARVRRERGDAGGALDDAKHALSLDLRSRDATTTRTLVAQLSGPTRRAE